MDILQPESPDPFDCLVPTTLAMRASDSGPLRGLSFVAKDLFAVKGHTSSFGHPMWRATHQPSKTTAPAIRDLLDAGADLVGMTKMDQLAYSLIGDVGEGEPPLNAVDPSLYCGGSSSGSAAAVAGGLADFALGTDTAGSVRVPAAVCGVLGIRPTHGLIPSEGILPLAPSFDVPGLFAKDVTSLAGALRVLAPSRPPSQAAVRLRVATDMFAIVDPQTARVGADVAEQAAALTETSLEEIALEPFANQASGALFARLQSREIWNIHARWVEEHAGVLAVDVRNRLERAKLVSQDPDEVRSRDAAGRNEFERRFRELVPPGTVVVLPVLPGHGPSRAWTEQEFVEFRTACFRLAAPASLTGAPQAVWSVHGAEGRSVGIGLLTAPGGDKVLLDVMAHLSETSAEI